MEVLNLLETNFQDQTEFKNQYELKNQQGYVPMETNYKLQKTLLN